MILKFISTSLLLVFFVILIGFTAKFRMHNNTDLRCKLVAEKSVITMGEIPKLKLTITNIGNAPLYLINILDGSASKHRMPYYYFTIQKPQEDALIFQRCRLLNPLKKEDFVCLNPQQPFNPYALPNRPDWVYDYAISQKESFKNPGIYKISFHYNTHSMDINDYMGSQDNSDSISAELRTLFKQLKHCNITSNTVEIKVLP